jgi:hypothetical protein
MTTSVAAFACVANPVRGLRLRLPAIELYLLPIEL